MKNQSIRVTVTNGTAVIESTAQDPFSDAIEEFLENKDTPQEILEEKLEEETDTDIKETDTDPQEILEEKLEEETDTSIKETDTDPQEILEEKLEEEENKAEASLLAVENRLSKSLDAYIKEKLLEVSSALEKKGYISLAKRVMDANR